MLAFTPILEGGMYIPNKTVDSKIAIIIPLRDRDSQLATFLNHYHKIFISQNLYYRIFAIVQSERGLFNRGKLFNAGIIEVSKYGDYDCYVFHDVDLLLQNDKLVYGCEKSPIHFSVAPSQFNYEILYEEIFGGVVALSRFHTLKVNGFSNCYWSWGGEDDDIRTRLVLNGYTPVHVNETLGRYLSNTNKHTTNIIQAHIHENRERIKWTEKLYKKDGLNSIKYTLLKNESFKIYTRITVDIGGRDTCFEDLRRLQTTTIR